MKHPSIRLEDTEEGGNLYSPRSPGPSRTLPLQTEKQLCWGAGETCPSGLKGKCTANQGKKSKVINCVPSPLCSVGGFWAHSDEIFYFKDGLGSASLAGKCGGTRTHRESSVFLGATKCHPMPLPTWPAHRSQSLKASARVSPKASWTYLFVSWEMNLRTRKTK